MVSPSPAPCESRSSLTKRSKIFSLFSGLMPMPVSVTVNIISFPSRPVVYDSTMEPVAVNLAALVRRLLSICCSLIGSVKKSAFGTSWSSESVTPGVTRCLTLAIVASHKALTCTTWAWIGSGLLSISDSRNTSLMMVLSSSLFSSSRSANRARWRADWLGGVSLCVDGALATQSAIRWEYSVMACSGTFTS